MKVGIVVVGHYSQKYRPTGQFLLLKFCDAFDNISFQHECNLYIIDNASTDPLITLGLSKYHRYVYINDQTKTGLTGAWNLGTLMAYHDNNDLIIICNDDIQFDESINNFIRDIETYDDRDISIFGPVSNGILSGVQRASQKNHQIYDLTFNESNMVNGFCFAFTRKFYEHFKLDDTKLFNEIDYPWGGNEEEIQRRIWLKGGKSIVLGSCFVYHEKIRGWKQHAS